MKSVMGKGLIQGLTIMLCLGMTVVMAADEIYVPPDPQAAAQRDVPEHDPGAELDGKTALEQARDLTAASEARRLAAAKALIEMEVNALPARDKVRQVLDHDAGGGMSPEEQDLLRLRALVMLHMMQAPEATDLWRAGLLDPGFLEQEARYGEMLQAAVRLRLDLQLLAEDLRSLGDSAPDHAGRMLLLDSIDSRFVPPLQEAAFRADHPPELTLHFLQNLSELEFLDKDARVEYVLEHRDVALSSKRLQNEIMSSLAELGTKPAFDALFTVFPASYMRDRAIAQFSRGPLPPSVLMESKLDHALAGKTRKEISDAVKFMVGVTADYIDRAQTDAERQEARQRFIDAMMHLIDAGSTADHAAKGVTALVDFVAYNQVPEFLSVIDPMLAMLRDDTASPELQSTVLQALHGRAMRMADLYGEELLDHLITRLWRTETPAEAEGPAVMLLNVMNSAEHARVVVRLVAQRFDEHLTQWVMNPATAVVIASGMTRGLERSQTRETASVMMGKALVSPAIDEDYLGPHLARGGGALASLENNTVAGVIATYEPTVFAEDKPDSYSYSIEGYMQPMLARPAWLAAEPEAKAEWIAFLERIVALDDPHFSVYAQRALDAF